MAGVARFDPARLDDISAVLREVRGWSGVEERSSATFYVNRQPFLHFHVGAASRRADVKCVGEWVQLDLPEPAPAASVRRLQRVLREEYGRRRA